MSNVRVCVDVVGGDEKPQVVLDGIEAALAADPDIEVLAAGPAEIVNPFAASHARVEALEAPDVIAMDDDPIRAVMTKRKSSIVLSCRAIKKGNADAFFSSISFPKRICKRDFTLSLIRFGAYALILFPD